MKTSSWMAAILIFALIAIVPGPVSSQQFAEDRESEVGDHMHEHLGRISAIKSFIIMGDLDGVREPAKWLAEHNSVAGLPDNYQPYVDSMRSHARDVLVAPDLKTAAMAVSEIAITCSNCHQANEVELAFGFDSEPDEWAEIVVHMQRHQWGVDRMWEGLIGPSDASWDRGTDMLVDVPLHPFEVMDKTASEAEIVAIDKIARRLHSLGSRGGYTKTLDERSKMFGEVLSICAECHTKLGRGPGR